MKKLLIILFILFGLVGLNSCDSLVYTTPVYYEYSYPSPYMVRPLPPPPPPRRPIIVRPQKPPVNTGNHRKQRR